LLDIFIYVLATHLKVIARAKALAALAIQNAHVGEIGQIQALKKLPKAPPTP
jgi:hypothetical protein